MIMSDHVVQKHLELSGRKSLENFEETLACCKTGLMGDSDWSRKGQNATRN